METFHSIAELDDSGSADHSLAQPAWLKGTRCLVLGAGGFLGRALCQVLDEAGAAVHAFGRTISGMHAPRLTTTGSFEDVKTLLPALCGQEIVFHLASSSLPEQSNQQPAEDVAREVLPAIRLLELCHKAGVRKVVFASSGGTVYGIPQEVPTPETAATAPISAYGINKLMVERYLYLFRHMHGLEYQVLRLANPYGPGQSPFKRQGVVAVMLHRALSGGTVEMWGTGTVTRDFIHVDDVAAAFLAAAAYDGPHRIMNVGTGQGRSLNQVASNLAEILDLPNLSVAHRSGRAADVPVSVLDTRLIRRETGWAPRVPWMHGLTGTAEWMRGAYPV